ncbi:unnamed protein product [Fructobacillus evanidus]|nr:unnamed protein product [Fructobacillus sp. LMG 32999]
MHNPIIVAHDATINAGSWKANDNFTSLLNDQNMYIDVSNIHFVDRTMFGTFSNTILNNVVEYIVSGNVNEPGVYKIVYMWGDLYKTNATRSQLLELLNSNNYGTFGDMTWATGYITVVPNTNVIGRMGDSNNDKDVLSQMNNKLPDTAIDRDNSHSHYWKLIINSLLTSISSLFFFSIKGKKNKNTK